MIIYFAYELYGLPCLFQCTIIHYKVPRMDLSISITIAFNQLYYLSVKQIQYLSPINPLIL
jgi:hypothetical protein